MFNIHPHNDIIIIIADINECIGTRHRCQICINTPGSYRCNCTPGYTLDEDGRTCHGQLTSLEERIIMPFIFMHQNIEFHLALLLYDSDIDECKTGTHNCQQNCHNNPGSFRCSCQNGYRLLLNGRCESKEYYAYNYCSLVSFIYFNLLNDMYHVGKTCGGIVNTIYATDLTPNGYPAAIITPIRCNWLLRKPLNRRVVRVTFTQFDVTGNATCSDNRMEIYDGLTRRLASLCTSDAAQRTFTLRSGFSLLKLIVTNPQNFSGFHAKLTVI